MKILALALIAVSAFAQHAVFPGAVVTDNQLGLAVNVTRAQLANSVGVTDTTFYVTNSSCVKDGYAASCASAFAANMFLVLDNEAVQVCGVVPGAVSTALQLGHASCPNIDGRGFDNTVIAAHRAAIISSISIAWNHNAQNKEIEAIERVSLGVAGYDWTPQTLSQATSPGTITIPLAPCPLGLNGSDTNHWVLLSAPVEPVLITGGTCSAGATTGTITAVTASARTTSWTVGPASSGIFEAIQAAKTSGGGDVRMQANKEYLMYAHPVVPSHVHLIGQGETTVLKVAANQWPSNLSAPQWLCVTLAGGSPMNFPCAITSENGADDAVMGRFTLDGNGANQVNYTGFASGAVLWNATNSIVEYIQAKGARFQGQMFHVSGFGGGHNIIRNNVLLGYGGSAGTCAGGILIQGSHVLVENNYADGNACDEIYVANGQNTSAEVSMDVRFSHNYAHANAGYVPYHAENSSYVYYEFNTCEGLGAACFEVLPVGGACSTMVGTHITGNIIKADTGGGPTLGISVSGGSGPSAACLVTGFDIDGNDISGVANGAIGHGISVGAGATNGSIRGNYLHGNTGLGAVVTSTATGITVQGNTVIGNTAGDFTWTYGSGMLCGNFTDFGYNGACIAGIPNAQVELGSKTASNAPYIDLNSSGSNNDYDFRLLASGGSGTLGKGNLTLTGGNILLRAFEQQLFNGTPAASATTIAPAFQEFVLNGSATITTITPPSGFINGCLIIHPDTGSTWTTATGGNILLGTTAIPHKILLECWDGTGWSPSY